MRPTVEWPIRSRAVLAKEPNDLGKFLNYETLPLLRQMRLAHNYKAVAKVNDIPTAATSVLTTIWTSADLAVGTAVRLDADVIGWDGSEPCGLTITGMFFNDGPAGAQQMGATAAGYTQNSLGLVVDFDTVDNHIELQVNDVGNEVIWTAVITAQVVG